MAVSHVDLPQDAGASETPLEAINIPDQTNLVLLEIIRTNFATKYASQTSSLAEFRNAVSTHGGIDTADDATLLVLFRVHVPLSNYESYKPFIDKFNVRPCREEEVKDLLAPGLPDFFALSSATSGSAPKLFPKYKYNGRLYRPNRRPLDKNSNSKDLLAMVRCTGYKDVKEVECTRGQVVQKIPVCIMTGGLVRREVGWYIDDESHMNLTVPGHVVPWAATVIRNLSSLFIIHGLFFLARRDIKRFYVSFAPMFVDLIHHIDEKWEVLVSSIKDGTVPDLEGIGHVQTYLQGHLHADPEWAAELLRIGPPFACEGWVNRVWPQANVLTTACNGPFASVLPVVKSVLGPNVHIRSPGYGATEGPICIPHQDKVDEFVFIGFEVVEFLDVFQDEGQENILQMREVETGKQYEPIVTTRDGLWRYRLGDVIQIVGFDAESESPLFKYLGRKSLTIHLPHGRIADHQILEAIQSVQSENTIRVQEFTSLMDDRAHPPTVGFLIEPLGSLGPDVRRMPQMLFDALIAATNTDEHRRALEDGEMRLPTIRIVKAGTFAEYRRWRSECIGMASAQSKVPLVLLDPTVRGWFLEKVVEEI